MTDGFKRKTTAWTWGEERQMTCLKAIMLAGVAYAMLLLPLRGQTGAPTAHAVPLRILVVNTGA